MIAYRFLGESEELSNNMSTKYYQVEKRYNYTTPKSILELIYFYKKLFKKQSDNLYEKNIIGGLLMGMIQLMIFMVCFCWCFYLLTDDTDDTDYSISDGDDDGDTNTTIR